MKPSAEASRPLDRQLVAEARAGCKIAFEALADRHYGAVLGYLTRLTGDADLAAEVTQETFGAALRHIDQVSDEGSFPGWLYQIARNQLASELRRRRVRRCLSLDWLPPGAETKHPALQRPDASAACGERDHVRRILDEMKPSLREAVELYLLHDLGSKEVARVLRISPEAARQRIHRGEREFRRLWDKERS